MCAERFFEGGRENKMRVQYKEAQRRRRKSASSRALVALAAVVMFAGLFMQVTMLSRIAAQSKAASRLEGEIEELTAKIFRTVEEKPEIAVRARQLGMEQPTETQIRVVNVARVDAGDTSTQAAENVGAESIRN